MKYAKVSILKRPGAFDRPLTYHLPKPLTECCQIGQGVNVELRGRPERGLIVELRNEAPANVEKVKDISGLDAELSLTPWAVNLASEIASYYGCSRLRALKLFVPKVLWQGKGVRSLKQIRDAGYGPVEPSLFPLKKLQHVLQPAQELALQKVADETRPVLLHGITGSGKTEVYLRLILDVVSRGEQAVLLVPEIAITPQMIAYFEAYFGSHMALFHSKLSDGQRLKEWFKVRQGHAPLIIGSRSAIFAPMSHPGLIIMDEEHEWTYKQESSPYYETHRVAEMIQSLTGCRLIFGTATPRLETYQKTLSGEYARVPLNSRIHSDSLPSIRVVDLRDEFKRKNYSIFSSALYNKIRERLDKKEQVILFVNQRGMARAVVCRDCGQSLTCPQCEISFKLHGGSYGSSQYLLCHYCGHRETLSLTCPHCDSANIRHAGIGTERVEEELFKAFPEARIVRADRDTTSNKEGFEPIYNAFKQGRYDILVGTQMVAKGLDFPNVTLIGIVLADIGLHIPDFRSHERLFQLITQVAGRAGRGTTEGEVILQTYQPDHHAIRMAADYAYEAFADQELSFRQRLNYPPFSRLLKFIVIGPDIRRLEREVLSEIEVLEDILRVNDLPGTVTAAPAMIAKVGSHYYYHVLVRSEDPHQLLKHWTPPETWRMDVDPVHTA